MTLYDISHSKDMENLKKDRENLKNMVDDLKMRSSEILGVKMEIFLEKTSFKNLGLRNFPSPQTRRQVSAYALCRFYLSILRSVLVLL